MNHLLTGSATGVRRHSNVTQRAQQLAVWVPVWDHTLAGDALTVYRVIQDSFVCSFILLLL